MSTDIQIFDYNINIEQALLLQYNIANNINQLVTNKNNWLQTNYSDFWSSWYYQVFNLWNTLPETDPNAFSRLGESIWSIILGIALQVPATDPNSYVAWGFENHTNYDNAPFAEDTTFFSRDIRLLILRLRYFQLVTRGDIVSINKFLDTLITQTANNYSGTVYATDNYDMTMTYTFTATPPYELGDVFALYDILPRPAGVSITIVKP